MRLAFLADASLPHTQRWVEAFVARGHECLLVSLEPGDGYTCTTRWLPARAALPRFARYELALPACRRALAAFRPDLVNAHFLPNYGWMAARLGMHPWVLTVLGSDVLTVPGRSPLHAWRTRWVLRRCDAVIADAAMLMQAVDARGGDGVAHRLVVPLGIERRRLEPLAKPPAPPWTVLSTRRLEPLYDVETLLRAVAALAPERRAALAVRIAGSGSQESALRRHAASLPVTFLGWLGSAALDDELVRAHFYVSTSTSDSTSVSLLEAMARGCFPIVTDIPGNREWVTHESGALLFPPGDARALAACLERALDDAALRERAVQTNREVVRTRACWEDGMDRVENLFREVAGGGVAGGGVPGLGG